MDRKSFLEKMWRPYPAVPPGGSLCGRLETFTEKNVSLIGKGSFPLDQQVKILPLKEDASQPAFFDWLNYGDQVALVLREGKVNEIWLLAPCQEEPLRLSSSPKLQEEWSHFLQQVRTFFVGKGFLEVHTPTLVTCPGTEPFLDLFSTELHAPGHKQKLFLPTSPELSLKKMLAGGYEKIFEIRPCFRNGEITDTHQPEFFMLEWYRAYSDLEQIKQDVLHLIEFVTDTPLTKDGEAGFAAVSMRQLFQEILQFDLTPETSAAELMQLAGRLGLSTVGYDLWDDLFYLLFVDQIEPKLHSEEPLFVEKYPPSQAALARLTEEGWGDRFELYWKGLEIANAFHELNDPKVQWARLQEDLTKKRHLGKEIPSIDDDFFRALRSGMPPSGGIALGLERLFMATRGIAQIQALKVFPYQK
jgi:lysyl-tRNA synthetase class 2